MACFPDRPLSKFLYNTLFRHESAFLFAPQSKVHFLPNRVLSGDKPRRRRKKGYFFQFKSAYIPNSRGLSPDRPLSKFYKIHYFDMNQPFCLLLRIRHFLLNCVLSGDKVRRRRGKGYFFQFKSAYIPHSRDLSPDRPLSKFYKIHYFDMISLFVCSSE